MQPHKHAEVIKAWADGATIEFKKDGRWAAISTPYPCWDLEEYRVKPEKVYPETRMSDGEIAKMTNLFEACGTTVIFRRFANAALRHAIDSDQVVPAAEVMELARALRKREFDAQSRDLGKAERLLESLGYRSAGDGEWVLSTAPDTTARDMAIAEAVRDNLRSQFHTGPMFSDPYIARTAVYGRISGTDLRAIIATVK